MSTQPQQPGPRHLRVAGDRPEPVLDAAATIRALGLVLGAVVAVLGIFGVAVTEQLVAQITTAITLVIGAAVAVWAIVVPLRRGMRVRQQVTPLADPRAADGTPLTSTRPRPLPGSRYWLSAPSVGAVPTNQTRHRKGYPVATGAPRQLLAQAPKWVYGTGHGHRVGDADGRRGSLVRGCQRAGEHDASAAAPHTGDAIRP